MKMNKIFFAAAFAGGLRSASAFATTTGAHGRMNAAIKFEAPVPVRAAALQDGSRRMQDFAMRPPGRGPRGEGRVDAMPGRP